MPRHTALLFAMATLSATAAVSLAQTASPVGPASPTVNSQTTQSQPAPIERAAVTQTDTTTYTKPITTGQTIEPGADTASVQATSGIFLRVGKNSSVHAINVTAENTELRVTHGVANVSVHLPAAHSQILVDLPGGQTALVKDGFYTFNAETNTVRVLKGQAFAYPGNNQKPIKLKEDHALIFGSPHVKAFSFDPFEARADLIPYDLPAGSVPGSGTANYSDDRGDYGYGNGYAGYGGYGGYGYPYGGFGFGSFYDSPYGYYPFGLGLYGLGFYGGGFYGGGYGGYYGGGFRGRDGDGDGHGGRGPRGGGGSGFHGGGGVRGGAGAIHGAGGGFHGGGGGGFHGGGGGGGFHGGGGGHR